MYSSNPITTSHKDLIHDVAFDYHGRRMATCSSDQTVEVFSLDSEKEWHLTETWKAHHGSIWKVNWAHPEFGTLLATCSFDRTAIVWEQHVSRGPQGETHVSWLKRGNLVDSSGSVTDVRFAPKHLGLMLATSSLDGHVRVYEATDVLNPSHWTMHAEIQCKMGLSCVAWNGSMRHPPLLAAGSDNANPQQTACRVALFEYSSQQRQWIAVDLSLELMSPVNDLAFAPHLGRSYSMLAVAGAKGCQVFIIKPTNGPTPYQLLSKVPLRDDCVVWRVCWNVTGTILASAGVDDCVSLWKANYIDAWKLILELRGDGKDGSVVMGSKYNEAMMLPKARPR